MYLGMKHFRIPKETLRIAVNPLSDYDLHEMHVPTLLLFGENEVLCDPVEALARARRLIPDFRGELIPSSSHAMCVSQRDIVDARICEFLDQTRRHTPDRDAA